MTEDENQLRLLSIFHYIVGGIAAVFALFPAVYLIFGIVIVGRPGTFTGEPPPAILGWFMIIFSGLFIIIGFAFAGFIVRCGRCIARRRSYLFCQVMAGVECIFMPFGTVLGVFTLLILARPSVKLLFEENHPLHPTTAR